MYCIRLVQCGSILLSKSYIEYEFSLCDAVLYLGAAPFDGGVATVEDCALFRMPRQGFVLLAMRAVFFSLLRQKPRNKVIIINEP